MSEPTNAPVSVRFTASEVHSVGGVPQFLARYGERLRAAGMDVSVMAGAPPAGASTPIEGLIAVPGLDKRFTLGGAAAMARAVASSPRETLLVANSLNAALVTAVAARLSGRRSLFFVHGLTSRYQTGFMFLACRLAELTAAAFAHGVIVLNPDDAHTLWTARRRLSFSHGVALPAERVREAPGEPVRLLAVARHEPQKNLTETLKALAACRTPFTLTIVGQGSLFERHARLLGELGLDGRVRLTPRLPPDALPWADHDIFLMASRSEGMPLSLLEAFAEGLPAIVTDVPGLRGLVDHGRTGAVLARLDGPSLDAALARILEDYPAMSLAARREAETRFDIGASAARLAELLAAACGRLAPAGRAG